jgi:hypothetical protein
MPETGQCELCGRRDVVLDRHHLIPRTRHSGKWNKREFDRQEVRERLVMLCGPCHKMIHGVLDEKTLEREYNTLEELRRRPDIARFVKWVRKQPPGKHVTVRRTVGRRTPNRRKGKRRKR